MEWELMSIGKGNRDWKEVTPISILTSEPCSIVKADVWMIYSGLLTLDTHRTPTEGCRADKFFW